MAIISPEHPLYVDEAMARLSQLPKFDSRRRVGENYAHTVLYCLKPGKKTFNTLNQAKQVDTQDADVPDRDGLLYCAECQYPITRTIDRIEVNEKHRHVFANPHGYIYQIGCFAQASGGITVGEEESHFSWFPGYTWRITACGGCLTLLGWAFRSRESRFFGLILKKLTYDIRGKQ